MRLLSLLLTFCLAAAVAVAEPIDAQPEATPVQAAVAGPPSAYNGYRPLPATAPLDQRRRDYQWMRVRDVEDGLALVGKDELGVNEQGRYYKQAGAYQAVSLLRQSRSARIQSVLWYSLAPALGFGIGAYAGYVVGVLNAASAMSSSNQSSDQAINNIKNSTMTGLVVGGCIGLGLGIPIGMAKGATSRERLKEAGQSFNQKLLQDLQLQAAPLPGGGGLKLQKRF